MRLICSVGIFLASIIHAWALSDTERQILFDKVQSGEINGGAYKLQIKPGAVDKIDKLKKRLFVEQVGGKYYVNRDLDPKWQNCMHNAGADWIVKFVSSPVPVVGPAIDAAMDLTDRQSVASCNSEWHKTLSEVAVEIRFDVSEATVKTKDALVRDYVDLIFQSLSADVVVLEQDGKRLKADVGDLEGGMATLSKQMVTLSAEHKTLVKLIISEHQKGQKLAEVASQRENVEASVMTVQLLSRIVLSKNPVALGRITTGAKSIGAIADSINQLKQDGLRSGAKIILSGNIANAALAIVGMFGPAGKDPTTALLESGFSAVRQDIQELSIQMNDRFDRVDHALEIINSSIQTRFTDIERRLTVLDNKLTTLDDRQKNYYLTEISAFRALLSYDFKIKMDDCLNPEAAAYLENKEFANCLTVIARYGTDNATNYVFTGAVLFDPTQPPEAAATLAADNDPDYYRGYLAASLGNAPNLLGVDRSIILRKVPSPMAWSGAVDSYIALRNSGPELRKVKDIDIKKLTSIALNDLKNTGKALLDSVEALRKTGGTIASGIYLRDSSAMAAPIADSLFKQVGSMDLGIAEEVEDRHYALSYPNNTIALDLHRGTHLIFKEGPEKGKEISKLKQQHRYVVLGWKAGPGDAPIRAADHMLHDDEPKYDLNTYEAPIFTDKVEVQQALTRANEAFLTSVNIAAWPPLAKAALVQAIQKPAGSSEVQKACTKMGLTKSYLTQLALLYRSKVDREREPWTRDLADLPGMSNEMDNTCDELSSQLSETGLPTSQADKLQNVLREWVVDELHRRVERFLSNFKNANTFGNIPEIETRMARLDRCLSASGLAC